MDVDAGPHGGGRGERAGSSEKDRRAAINMLPNADLSNHTCDSCSKDITGVSQRHFKNCRRFRHLVGRDERTPTHLHQCMHQWFATGLRGEAERDYGEFEEIILGR